MKKVVSLTLILITLNCMIGNVYAAFNCEINLQTNKTEFSKNEEIIVDVNISNIQSDRGVISLGATLEYDKDSLTLVKMEGRNGWETPAEGASYNSENGAIAITRSGLGKSNETVFRITFKTTDASKKNLTITLKDITVADGTQPVKITAISKNITIKDESNNPDIKPEPDTNTIEDPITNTTEDPITNTTEDSITNTTESSITNTIKDPDTGKETNTTTTIEDSTTTSDKKLPQTGDDNIIIKTLLGITIIVAILVLIKINIINKRKIKMEKD